MPPGVRPIALFRTFTRHLPVAAAMSAWGGYELSKELSLSMRDRELLIDRTCARCGCEYEWGVHIAFFAERVGFTSAQVASLTQGDGGDACWNDRDRSLVEIADQLHDSATVDDALYCRERCRRRERGGRSHLRQHLRLNDPPIPPPVDRGAPVTVAT